MRRLLHAAQAIFASSPLKVRPRTLLRGYRKLREAGNLGSIAAAKRELTELKLPGIHASPLIFGSATGMAERSVRQFLLLRLGGAPLTAAQLRAAESGLPLTHAMPLCWSKALRQQGVAVAAGTSAALLWLYCFAMLAAGVRHWVRVLVTAPGTGGGRKGTFSCFDGLAPGNLPLAGTSQGHDIISWYDQWADRAKVDWYGHGVAGQPERELNGKPVLAMSPEFPPLMTAGRVRFFFRGLAASLLAMLDLFRGRWWHALILKEAVTAAAFRYARPEAIARDYLFHNSNWIYRPLWSHEAQARGARVLFYFYSTNCEAFARNGKPAPLMFGWKAMSWSRYLVWDHYQEAFVRRAAGESASVDVVGPISFQAGVAAPQTLPARTVLAFDVQPMRDSHYRLLGLDFDYYVPEVCNGFLQDLFQSVTEQQATMGLKRKREIGKASHPRYRHLLSNLASDPGFLSIDPDTAAMQLIPQAAAVVSMPFTSTAILARLAGKPSVFYDPLGVCDPADPAAHGIPVLRNRMELKCWLSEVLALSSKAGNPQAQTSPMNNQQGSHQ